MPATVVRDEDLDHGGIWIAFEVVALAVAVAMLLVAAGLLFSHVEVPIEPGRGPAGYHTYEIGAAGEPVVHHCPSPIDALIGAGDPFCRDDTRTITVAAAATGAGALVFLGLLATAHRQRRRLKGEAAGMGEGTEVLLYRQDSMPWGYWLAALGVCSMGGLMAAAAMGELMGRGSDRGVGPALAWAGIVVFPTVWVYGRRRAYELRLHGDQIEWRAPLRRRQFPLADVATADVRLVRRVLREREGIIVLSTGDRLAVVVPNRRHERRFLALCDAIRDRRHIEGPAGVSRRRERSRR